MSQDSRTTTRRRGARLLAVASATGLIATACGGSSGTAAPATTSGSGAPATTTAPGPTTTVPPGSALASAMALQQAFREVAAKVRPEVVQIVSPAGDLGSGVIYDDKGDIVTNAHVVGTGVTTFQVTFFNGQTTSATLVGSYPADDLAVIKVRGAKQLSPATFGDSKALQVGDITLAIGNPLGQTSSVTEGIVSFNGRTVQESATVTLPSTIQTSAAINPGNSGGALVNIEGQVVGIPTLAAANQQDGGTAAGIGYAVPSSIVQLIAPQLIATGKVTNSGRAALGVQVTDGISTSGQPVGVVVYAVTPGGAAAKAGIKAGDLITAVNGTTVTNTSDLTAVLASLSPGQAVKVALTDQSGAQRTVTVTLEQLAGS
ncbi:trypsin-like peptidase domain-containing protein [Acidiferrimicrobium sp. IK]|uniref:S1C family serine protease n=1 Tax=Acidiferrimicrobium sp. IK TaxID=2871700 RepID=UPI0021CAFB8E|nr:trypsin-like peptidase domain-containing protein [Acidiferrimicrobium sp. IK]MCU4185458.1 trypsin-like peptidase domain-containing protein [Acidiferrimicrobium sp. IK]